MKKILMLAAVAAVMAGCSKEQGGNKGIEPGPDGKIEVKFSGGMDIVTKAPGTSSSALPAGTKALIYAYADATDIDGEAALSTSSSKYEVVAGNTNGDLSLITTTPVQKGIRLAVGTYDFYAVSPETLAFTNSNPGTAKYVSGDLENGVDYLWVKKNQQITTQTVPTPGNNVGLVFERKAVKLHFTVKPGTDAGVTSISLGTAAGDNKVTPPLKTGAKMNLSDGVIAQVAAVNTIAGQELAPTKVENKVDATTSQNWGYVDYIMLPLANKDASSSPNKIKLTFKVQINDEKDAATSNPEYRTYSKEVTVPQDVATGAATAAGGYESGYQYNYEVTIKGNEITFSGAKVEDWVEKDLTGTPIVPDEN